MTVADEQKDLPIAYWLVEMHKTPVGFDFIVASKQFRTKPLTKTVSNIFKMIYSHVESFNNQSRFYSNFKHCWLVQNSFPIANFCTFILQYGRHV